MPRVSKHIATLRPLSAAVSTGAAFSDDDGFSDGIEAYERRYSEQLQVGITRLEAKREAVDVEYEAPEHEKKR